MRRFASFLIAAVVTVAAMAQTLNVEIGSVTYQIPAKDAGQMMYADGNKVTIAGRTYYINTITRMYVDNTAVSDTTVTVTYSDNSASVVIDGRIARYLTVSVEDAHVSIAQSSEVGDDTSGEITYCLSGSSSDGEFYMSGSYKATVEMRGLTLTNPTGAPINIQNGKRIDISVKKGIVNTLADGTDNKQKGTILCKGHAEFKGQGTLNISSYGVNAHGIWCGDYMTVKNCTINIQKATKDGINCNQYFQMKSGALTLNDVGSDGIQCSIDNDEGTPIAATTDHDDEDTGSIYIDGGSLNLTVSADAAKGLKSAGDISISAGSVTITQAGGIEVEGSDISYPTSIKADGNISVTGGTVDITNTGAGGKGMSAEGTLTIDETNADVSTNVTIKANGKGGTAETTSDGDSGETTSSYKVYVSLPTSGGGGMGPGGSSAWTTLYLYKSDGTLVQQLTSTVSKSSGYSTATFYYYDFKAATDGTYYFKSADYTSRGGWGGGSGTTYAIQSATFSAPTSGTDIYYSITNSYSTSGTTRTYSLTNVTSTYSGSSDVSEDEGTAYNAIGLKADGNLTINAGTVTISNSGAMSKSIKSKATTTINGGTTTLTPSGAMQVINNDASYSSGVKTADFVQNGGTLKITASGNAGRGITATNITTNGGTLNITNSGAGVEGSSDSYTAKGLKADTSIKLNGGTITITMSGTGGKGIKSSGTYTQGTSDGNGPTLTVKTSGAALGSSSSGGGGGGWGMGPGQESSGSSAKGIKVQGTIYLYGGTSEVYTETNGAEGLESKTAIYVEGGKHYFKCYDDCINSSGMIVFNGGITVCYGFGNDAIDSNYGRTGAITIGNGVAFAYTTKGSPEEGFDCDNNSYIQITGTGIGISAGAAQGGGGGGSSSTISNAKQGYAFVTSSISYTSGRYYTLADSNSKNLVTYSFEASCSSTLALFTATGMVKGSSYTVKYSTSAPTDATTAWHGLYLGSSAAGTTSVTSFTAQ